jgi:hypothetical protein
MLQNQVYPKPEIEFPRIEELGASIVTCDVFYEYPLLAERSCENIYGDNDNLLMQSRGALMLHELTHFRTLNLKASFFLGQIQRGLGQNSIFDYQYGARGCHLLTNFQDARCAANADNYMFHALSKYWQKKCPEKNGGRGWGTAVDDNRPGPPVGDTDEHCRLRDVYDRGLLDDGTLDPNWVPSG